MQPSTDQYGSGSSCAIATYNCSGIYTNRADVAKEHAKGAAEVEFLGLIVFVIFGFWVVGKVMSSENQKLEPLRNLFIFVAFVGVVIFAIGILLTAMGDFQSWEDNNPVMP